VRACNASSRFARFNGHGAVFVDDVQSYNTVEPAIDLTASSPLAFAWQITTAAPRHATADFSLRVTPASQPVGAAPRPGLAANH
jgi:hypothetical protein